MNKKLTLRKYRLSDLKIIYRLFANDKVLKNLSLSKRAKEISIKEEKEWIKKVLKEYKRKKKEQLHLAVVVNGEIVGGIGAKEIDYKNQKAEIGYWFGEEYWGKGYATEAIKKFSKILIKEYKLVRIEAFPYSRNIASQRVLEKAGFKLEGERKKAVKKFGKFMDDKIYSLVR